MSVVTSKSPLVGASKCGPDSCGPVNTTGIRTCPCDLRIKTPDTEINQSSTLLKYTNPFKVIMNIRKGDMKPKPTEIGQTPDSELLTDHSPETQEVLDCIQEPRMWLKNGELWTQVVSPATTKRHEIITLFDDLNRRLWKRHARPNGMCRIRYEISRQLFDELTRQVTITCAQRGLFLVRIRAEINYTIQVYHYMWRDIMEYFDPIVQKTLYEVMSTGNFDISRTSDILSLDEERDKESGKVRKKSDLDVSQALQLSDTLKELVNERKLAVGRTNTKRLLEDEIVWARGEISKNKAYLTDLLSIKEPLDYEEWLARLVEGRDEPTEITLALCHDKTTPSVSPMEHQTSSHRKTKLSAVEKNDTSLKIPFIKWIRAVEPGQCRCRGRDCALESCGTIDWDLLIQQARAEFVYGVDDRPLVTFDEFFENWLTTRDVRQIYAISHLFENKEPSPYGVKSVRPSQSNAIPAGEAGDKEITFIKPCSYRQRITEFSPSKDNPYRLQSSSIRPNFREHGRMIWERSNIFADSFAPLKCNRRKEQLN